VSEKWQIMERETKVKNDWGRLQCKSFQEKEALVDQAAKGPTRSEVARVVCMEVEKRRGSFLFRASHRRFMSAPGNLTDLANTATRVLSQLREKSLGEVAHPQSGART